MNVKQTITSLALLSMCTLCSAHTQNPRPQPHAAPTPALIGVLPMPREVRGGDTTRLEIKLTHPAKDRAIAVELASSHPRLLRLPKRVSVPAGARSLGLTVKTGKVEDTKQVEIRASIETVNRKTWVTLTP